MSKLIIAENKTYDLDCYTSRCNNNVLVVGGSGCGKTRGIVEPNILEATGSYIICDPKGNLYKKYKNYLNSKGYIIKHIDFVHPNLSARYNFFDYIKSTQDIIKVSNMLIETGDKKYSYADPIWRQAGEVLLSSLIALIKEREDSSKKTIGTLYEYLGKLSLAKIYNREVCELDELMVTTIREDGEEGFAYKQYLKIRNAAPETLLSVSFTVGSVLGFLDTPEVNQMMQASNAVDFSSIGRLKTAVFISVSDSDRSMDGLINLFFTQAMNELCLYADEKCLDNRLPVPVRFILDDFATNCKIEGFPKTISSIRSRNISAMIMLQSENQLKEAYFLDGKTIIANCDTYVYLGGNDLDTAASISKRTNRSVMDILSMPLGSAWVFRRGEKPSQLKIYNLCSHPNNLEQDKNPKPVSGKTA